MTLPKLVSKIVVVNGSGQVLLLRRSKTAPVRVFDWELPGGIVESGEDPKATALRELQEEAGIVTREANYAYAGTDNRLEHTGLAFYTKVINPKVILSYEHDMFKWVELDEAMDIVTEKGYRLALNAYKNMVYNSYKVKVSTKCLIANTGDILLLKRSANDVLGAGQWDLPGGGMEQSETVWDTIRREIAEETKLNVNNLQLVFGHTEVHGAKKQIKIRLGLLADTDNQKAVLSDEHSEFIWVKRSHAYDFAKHPHWPGWADFVKIFG